MLFSCFQSVPTGLSAQQRQEWDYRRQNAERILAKQAQADPHLETVAHLQHYVNGDITLGQAIGRVLDAQARTH